MDVELIKSLADLPIVAILIYLLIREQGAKEKILTSFMESERCHHKDLVDIILSGRISVEKYSPAPPRVNLSEMEQKLSTMEAKT